MSTERCGSMGGEGESIGAEGGGGGCGVASVPEELGSKRRNSPTIEFINCD